METRNFKLDLQTAKEWFKSENETLKKIASQTFPELIFEELPKRWEDLKEIKGYYIDKCSVIRKYNSTTIKASNENTFTTKELAEASIALAQLSQLRYEYRNGWKPDWNNVYQKKYVICFIRNEICIENSMFVNNFLSFQDEKTRNLFFTNFKELIKKTLPFFS